MKISFLAAAATLLLFTTAHGQALKNGDFSDGRAHWEGAGKVLTLDGSQKPVEEKAEGSPQLQISLNKTMIQETKQRLSLPPNYNGPLSISVVLKTSPDFAINGKSPRFTPNKEWKSGTWWWSALVYPKVDFCIRVDAGTMHHYLPRELRAGGDWQTVSGRFDSVEGPNKALSLVTTAGDGTVWIRSVTVEAK